MRQHLLLSLVLITAFSCSPADPGVQEKAQDGPFIRMRVERLPSMNTPRGAHAGMVVGGELAVFGGHTDGFVRTQTAEYFRDGVGTRSRCIMPTTAGLPSRSPTAR